jgi:NAD(P)-dependent dehydrogenase (short-subunit alcohol dehydrogenase family)
MTDLQDKIAVVFAATGEIAGAVAKSLAVNGAKVYVSGKDLAKVKAVAAGIIKNGGNAEAAVVDAMNEKEIDGYLQKIANDHGRLDIVFNGIGKGFTENGTGIPATEVSFEQFLSPLRQNCGSQFLTSRAAAKYMIQTGSYGTILMLTASLSKMKIPLMTPISAACAAIEGMTRAMAAEFGPYGIKVICICSSALYETAKMKKLDTDRAKAMGISLEQLMAMYGKFDLLPTRLTLKQVGEVASFLASDNGVPFNSHVVDVDCGKINVL